MWVIALLALLGNMIYQDLAHKSKTNLTEEQEVVIVQNLEKEPDKIGDFSTEMGGSSPEPIKTPQRASTLSTEAYRPLVEKYFSPIHVEDALIIMKYESGGNPNAVSPTNDHGLMQINAPTWCTFLGVNTEQLKDPELNISLAYRIWDRADGVEGNGEGSFKPWTTYRYLSG